MNRKFIGSVVGLSLVAFAASAAADPTADLIALDNQWGMAGISGDADAVAAILADNLISVDPTGVSGKAAQLANTEAAPAGAMYEVSDYQVMFLNEHTAVMTHSVAGDEAHYSMHVWQHKDGNWLVVATSSTPADSE